MITFTVLQKPRSNRTLDRDKIRSNSSGYDDHHEDSISSRPKAASAIFEAQSEYTRETRNPSIDYRGGDLMQGACEKDPAVSEPERFTHPAIEEVAGDQTASPGEAHEASQVLHKDSREDAQLMRKPSNVTKEGDATPERNDKVEESPSTHVPRNTQNRPHADRRHSDADHSRQAESGDGTPPSAEATRDVIARDQETPLDGSETASHAYNVEKTTTNHTFFERSERADRDSRNVKPSSLMHQDSKPKDVLGDPCVDSGTAERFRDLAKGDAGAGDTAAARSRLVPPEDARNENGSRENDDLSTDREPQSPPAMSRRSRTTSGRMSASPVCG